MHGVVNPTRSAGLRNSPSSKESRKHPLSGVSSCNNRCDGGQDLETGEYILGHPGVQRHHKGPYKEEGGRRESGQWKRRSEGREKGPGAEERRRPLETEKGCK